MVKQKYNALWHFTLLYIIKFYKNNCSYDTKCILLTIKLILMKVLEILLYSFKHYS